MARSELVDLVHGCTFDDLLFAPQLGVVTRRDLTGPEGADRAVGSVIKRPPVVIFPDSTLREAADQMVRAQVGRLAVVDRANPRRLVGVLSRSDVIAAHARRLKHLEDDD